MLIPDLNRVHRCKNVAKVSQILQLIENPPIYFGTSKFAQELEKGVHNAAKYTFLIDYFTSHESRCSTIDFKLFVETCNLGPVYYSGPLSETRAKMTYGIIIPMS